MHYDPQDICQIIIIIHPRRPSVFFPHPGLSGTTLTHPANGNRHNINGFFFICQLVADGSAVEVSVGVGVSVDVLVGVGVSVDVFVGVGV